MFDDKQIVFDNVTVLSRNRSPILKNVSCTVDKGDLVFISGRTGSGKSTFLRSIYADIIPAEGTLKVLNYNIKTISKSETPLLRRKLGVVFQDFKLLNTLSVRENLELALKATGWNCNDSIERRIHEVLDRLKITWMIDKLPLQLSGGEQQRVSIARAILNDPSILLADEPTGSLDPDVEEDIINYLLEINSLGVTVIIATHSQILLSKYNFRNIRVTNGFCSE